MGYLQALHTQGWTDVPVSVIPKPLPPLPARREPAVISRQRVAPPCCSIPLACLQTAGARARRRLGLAPPALGSWADAGTVGRTEQVHCYSLSLSPTLCGWHVWHHCPAFYRTTQKREA